MHLTMDSGRRIQLLSIGVGKCREGYSPVAWLHACLLFSSPCREFVFHNQSGGQGAADRTHACPFLFLWRVILMLIYTLQWSDAPRLRHPVGFAEDSALWCLWPGRVWCSYWFSRGLLWQVRPKSLLSSLSLLVSLLCFLVSVGACVMCKLGRVVLSIHSP